MKCPECGYEIPIDSTRNRRVEYLENQKRVLQVLNDGKEHRFMEICEETKMSRPTLSKHLKDLCKENTVERKIVAGSYPPLVIYKLKQKQEGQG